MITSKIYETMQDDIERIDDQLKSISGSYNLWDELRVKYEMIFPDLKEILNRGGGKVSFSGEFDYRPELKRVKSALLTKLLLSEVDSSVNLSMTNDAKIILENKVEITTDEKLNELLEESMLYIRKNRNSEKQIGLEKIWDAFERLKTYYNEDKKESAEFLLKNASQGSNKFFDLLNTESMELTKIGNEFQIRHFEQGKAPIISIEQKEYLYFRLLAFLSFCMKCINNN